MNKNKEKLLLHICCGVCGAWIPKMLQKKFEVVLYFFNPNIWPKEEYERRLNGVKKVAEDLGINLIEGEYSEVDWLHAVSDFKDEPEGGKRCEACFDFRLGEAARYAKENDFLWFASTLTSGRNKKAAVINPIGEKWAKQFGINFLAEDFKKGGGQIKTEAESKRLGLYRQNYCGCVYSFRR
jgi:predicted adenine nucleotide alpha hydrolase (AANH) superfamily ATPase